MQWKKKHRYLKIAAQSALSIASLCVQHIADVETLNGFKPCSLFCLTIAESGERKSSCDNLLMNAVFDVQEELHREYKNKFLKYKTSEKIFKAQEDKKLSAMINKKNSNSEELDNFNKKTYTTYAKHYHYN